MRRDRDDELRVCRARAAAAGRLATGLNASIARAQAIAGLCAAFPYALKQHLRGERSTEELLDAATAASGSDARSPAIRRLRLASVSPNVPLAVLDALSRTVLPVRAKGELVWWQLDNNVEQLLTLLARAERLKVRRAAHVRAKALRAVPWTPL